MWNAMLPDRPHCLIVDVLSDVWAGKINIVSICMVFVTAAVIGALTGCTTGIGIGVLVYMEIGALISVLIFLEVIVSVVAVMIIGD